MISKRYKGFYFRSVSLCHQIQGAILVTGASARVDWARCRINVVPVYAEIRWHTGVCLPITIRNIFKRGSQSMSGRLKSFLSSKF